MRKRLLQSCRWIRLVRTWTSSPTFPTSLRKNIQAGTSHGFRKSTKIEVRHVFDHSSLTSYNSTSVQLGYGGFGATAKDLGQSPDTFSDFYRNIPIAPRAADLPAWYHDIVDLVSSSEFLPSAWVRPLLICGPQIGRALCGLSTPSVSLVARSIVIKCPSYDCPYSIRGLGGLPGNQ